MDELKNDMEMLAKFVYDLGKKHGDIYIAATHVKGAKISWANHGNKDIMTTQYFGPDWKKEDES